MKNFILFSVILLMLALPGKNNLCLHTSCTSGVFHGNTCAIR